jgi:uncharacterized damage-inducible protein DinB
MFYSARWARRPCPDRGQSQTGAAPLPNVSPMDHLPEPARTDLRLRPPVGFSDQIGALVAMLDYTRRTTLEAVQELSLAQLDHRVSAQGNSIGTLLAHIAAVEWAYSVATFEQRLPDDAERAEWGPALRLGDVAWQRYRGWQLGEYFQLLAGVRQHSLSQLRQREDSWLDTEFKLIDGSRVDHRWAWFHVFEDELSHRGQMLLIRNHLLTPP